MTTTRVTPEVAAPRATLIAAQLCGQGTRVGFHVLAAARLGIEDYGRFVVVFSTAVLLATIVGLGIRHRMQYLLASARGTDGLVTIGAVIPLAIGSVLAGGTALFGFRDIAIASLLAVGMAGADIAGETLKGEGRPALGIVWPPIAVFLVPTLALIVGVVDESDRLVSLVTVTGIAALVTWTLRQVVRLGRPARIDLRELRRAAPPLVGSSFLTQAVVQIPIFFAATVSDEDAGVLGLALRIVGVANVTAGTVGTPTVRATARAYWRGEPAWPDYRAGLRRIAVPTLIVVTVIGFGLLNPTGSDALVAGDLRTIGLILFPGVVLGAFTGPVTLTLYALDRPAPTIVAYAIALVVVVAGGVLALTFDTALWVAISLSAALLTQNLLQLRSVRQIVERGRDG